VSRQGVKGEPGILTRKAVPGAAPDAAEVEAAFEWPPRDDSVVELFRVPDQAGAPEPVKEVAFPPEVPIRLAHSETSPRAVAVLDEDAHAALQQALRSWPEEHEVPVVPPRLTTRREPVVPARVPPAWRPARAGRLALVLLALVAGAEGLYIVTQAWRESTVAGDPAAPPPTAAATPAESAGPTAPAVLPAAIAEPPAIPARNAVPPAATAQTTGRLSIDSEPSGAQVSIDGRSTGVTPLTLSDVPAGERRILLKLGGREVRQTLRVEPGGTASLIVPMIQVATSTSGWIALTATADLDILEDGALIGSTRSPQVMMAAGPHTLQLVSEALGYSSTQTVRIEPGKVARMRLTLPDSILNLNAQPWAEVWVDGKPVGETPIGNLRVTIGAHQILFRHPELGEKIVSTVVRADAPTRVTVDLRK
jgi:PEGA domain